MSESPQSSLNVREEFEKGLANAEYKLELKDLRIYFRVAFKSFIAKIAVVNLILSLFVLFVYRFFESFIPEQIKYYIFAFLALVLLVIVITVIVRANSGLFSLAKNLAENNAEYRLNEKRAEVQISALSQERKTHKDLFESNAVLYGLSFDLSRNTVTIDKVGGAQIQTVVKVNATRRGMKAIERYNQIYYEGYEGKTKLDLPTKDIKLSDQQLLILSPTILREKQNRVEWLLTANPEFPKDIPVQYEYITDIISKSFAMTMKELQESGNEFEWYSQHVSYPTKLLNLKVIFPENYVAYNPDIAIWNSPYVKNINLVEYNRTISLTDAWKVYQDKKHRILELRVEYPITGIHYAITWSPFLDWE